MNAFPRTLFSTSLYCCNRIYRRSNIRRISFSLISPCLLSTPKKRLHHHTNAAFAAKPGFFSPKLSHLFSTGYFQLSNEESSNAPERKQVLAGVRKRYSERKQSDLLKEVYVREIDPDFDSEELLIELFSQFGKVENVYISRVSKIFRSRYAIVIFNDPESAAKAVQAKQVTTTSGSSLFIHTRTNTRSTAHRTYIIRNLPDNIDATHIFNHFKSFCDVELVYMYVYSINSTSNTYNAAIVFKDELNSILAQEHEIGNSILSVNKASEDFVVTGRSRGKCLDVFLQGVSDNVTEDEINSHFKTFGEIRNVRIVTDRDTGKRNGFGYVNFFNQTSAHTAAQGVHTISDSNIKASALGYSSWN